MTKKEAEQLGRKAAETDRPLADAIRAFRRRVNDKSLLTAFERGYASQRDRLQREGKLK